MTLKIQQFLLDLLERVSSTFAQVFLVTLFAAGTGHILWGDIAAVAAFAAFASFLTTVLIWLVALNAIQNPYLDLLYRAVITFGQSLLGLVVAAGAISALQFHWSFALKVSLIAAGISLLKGLIGLNNPQTLGASPLVLRIDGERRRTTKLLLVA